MNATGSQRLLRLQKVLLLSYQSPRAYPNHRNASGQRSGERADRRRRYTHSSCCRIKSSQILAHAIFPEEECSILQATSDAFIVSVSVPAFT
jgi:hypothetical protein